MRLVFAGTPDAAVPSLDALLESSHDVVAVLTRPDAAAGRGKRPAASAIATRAAEVGLRVLRPERPGDAEFLAELAGLAPECVPVVAYGALVPRSARDIPAYGWINLHFSLLPAWRGAAPVQHAVWHGDDVTGATTFLLEQGLDTGPVYGVVTETVRPTDTSGDLLARLSTSGAGLLVATLDGIERGALVAQPQSLEGVSLAPKLSVADARVDWSQPAVRVDRQIRACTPAPGAWTMLADERVGIGPVRIADESLPIGVIAVGRREVLVGTASNAAALQEIRPAGKRAMAAVDWARGARLPDAAAFA